MLNQDKIINFLRMMGPTLPSKVAKFVQSDILLASALLSDLTSQGRVKISHLKVGGSPLYYLPGQENRLHEFALGNLNPKDLQVMERLKKEKVLRENNLDLLAKVALRYLKDFAVPLHVTIRGSKELFWKWYLASEDETNKAIAAMLNAGRMPIREERKEEMTKKEETKEEIGLEEREKSGDVNEIKEVKETVKEEAKSKEEAESIAEKSAGKSNEWVEGGKKIAEEEYIEIKPDIKPGEAEAKQQQLTAGQAERQDVKQDIEQDIDAEKPGNHEIKEYYEDEGDNTGGEYHTKGDNTREESQTNEEYQTGEKEKIYHRRIKKRRAAAVSDDFMPAIEKSFHELGVKIDWHKIVRKNSEINFLIKVPSAVGSMTYFCKAKNKSKCDEKDVSSAYMEAQIKKLPLLFLYTKEITKKTEEMLKSEAFQNAVVRKIEGRISEIRNRR